MAKKKANGGLEESHSRPPRCDLPEFPEVLLEGWTGTVFESSGKPPSVKVIIEWDATTLAKMPPDYVARCESQQLYYQMACLNDTDVEPA